MESTPSSPLNVPPIFAVPPALPTVVVSRVLAEGERLWPTIAFAVVLVALGDFLFWGFTPGLSLAIFVAAVAGMLLLRNGRASLKPRVLIPFGLLIASAVQTAVEMSFTNCTVIAALFAVLMGELYFTKLPSGWARWSESIVAWMGAPGRWAWLIQAVGEQPGSGDGTARFGDRLLRFVRIGLPAVLLLALFGGVFASGNRIFAEYIARFWDSVRAWPLSFDFSVPRMLFWWFLATLALVFMRPRNGAATPRAWARALPEWRRADAGVAFWQSVTILAALNALFFAVNTIDVIFLWMHTAVPEGMNGKAFLHEGVNSLIAATVLAGIVLTVLFQQSAEARQTGTMRGLAFAWVAQNLVLIAGVFLRLKLYVDTEEMTAKRVYVACFLLLVTLGFAFLCVHVRRGRDASRLIWRNAVTTFALFFVLQFLNVIGWVCRYNVERGASRSEDHGFHIAYQLTLGPDAWPVLLKAAREIPPGAVRDDVVLGLREVAERERPDVPTQNWRDSQIRRDRNAAALFAWAAPLGELTPAEMDAPIIRDLHEMREKLYRMSRGREYD